MAGRSLADLYQPIAGRKGQQQMCQRFLHRCLAGALVERGDSPDLQWRVLVLARGLLDGLAPNWTPRSRETAMSNRTSPTGQGQAQGPGEAQGGSRAETSPAA
jgi:hypothetical protein